MPGLGCMMTVSTEENSRLGVQSMLSVFHRHESIASDTPAQAASFTE